MPICHLYWVNHHLFSPNLILPYLSLLPPIVTGVHDPFLPYLTLPYFTLPYFTLPYLTLPLLYLTLSYLFFLYQLTVGASRLMEAQMDLPRLLFGVGFQNVYVLLNTLKTCEANCYYSLRCI